MAIREKITLIINQDRKIETSFCMQSSFFPYSWC